MIRYYLLLFVRNLLRYRMFSAINLLGLTTGIAASILIYLYVDNELGYDRFHTNAERIYRINQTFIWGDGDDNLFASTGPGVAHAIAAEIPEAKEVTRLHPPGNTLLSYTNRMNEVKTFDQTGILAVDSNFFRVFSFKLLKGNPETALKEGNSMVMTTSAAKKYFGDEDPVGKMVEVKGFSADQEKQTYVVTGLVENPPANSYVEFEVLLSMSSFPSVKRASWSWVWTMFETFVLIDEKASPTALTEKVNTLPRRYAEKTLQIAMGTTYDEYTKSGKQWNLYAQPLTDIRLHSANIYNRINDVGSITTIYILSGIVGVILLLSCINFMNLSTAQFTRRAKETSLRKVLGSNRWQLSTAFFIEAFLFCLLSVLLAIGFVELLLPQFNNLTGNNYTTESLFAPRALMLIATLLVGVSVLCGSYPAIFMTTFNPVEVMKGKLKSGHEGKRFRNALVVFQFSISMILLIGTLVVFRQISFLARKDAGFNRENVLVLGRLEWINDKETFLNAVKNINAVKNASWCTSAPPKLYDGDGFMFEDKQEKVLNMNYVMADQAYAETLELKFATGRNFSRERKSDELTVILNESAVHEAGWAVDEGVLGKRILYADMKFEVIGVVKDFNYWSLQSPIQPMALFNIAGPMTWSRREFAAIRIGSSDSQQITAMISALEAEWKKFAGDVPFQYEFVDQAFAESFAAETRFGKALMVFAGLAIIIASLGLLGMIVFTLELRTKEIGIRKVVGATVTGILFLVMKDYAKLIFIAIVLSVPLSFYVTRKWLEGFLHRVEPGADIFIIAAASVCTIALLITGYHCMKAARRNPVEVLKDE